MSYINVYTNVETKSSGTYTIDFSKGDVQHHYITIGGDFTLTASNYDSGTVAHVVLTQDGTGSHTVTLNSVLKWAGGSAPTLTTAANSTDTFVFISCSDKAFEQSRALDVK